MRKTDVQRLLSCRTNTEAADAIGITPQAFSKWPEELTPKLEDRVLAVLARRFLSPELIGRPPVIEPLERR